LQDLLIFSLKGLGGWAHLASQNSVEVPQEIQSFITGATFSTLTNGEKLCGITACHDDAGLIPAARDRSMKHACSQHFRPQPSAVSLLSAAELCSCCLQLTFAVGFLCGAVLQSTLMSRAS
jgi:hypothetical protein